MSLRRLVDKFGDNGIVTVVAGETKGVILHIRLWLMSCRVLKRGMEDAMMNTLVDLVKKRGLDTIKGYYYTDGKKQYCERFLQGNGVFKDRRR